MRKERSVVKKAVGAAMLAATILVLAAPATAVAKRGTSNSFAGTCSGLEGHASWPEHPLTVLPVDMLMLVDPSGGQCTGTVNGRDVDGVPVAATARLRGPQSCGAGVLSGRFTFKIAGRKFAGRMTYRRIASRVTALWEGDGGGHAAIVVRAQTGIVAKDDPLAGTPVVGSAIAGEVSTEETVRRCAGEGIRRMPILVEQIRTLSELRSR